MIEALVALVLASVGLLGMARLQVTLAGDRGELQQQLQAQRLLRDKIESTRSLPASSLLQLTSGADQPTGDAGASFRRVWSVVNTGDATQRMMVVGVGWTDRLGRDRRLEATALMPVPEGRMLAALSEPLLPGQSIRGPLDRSIDVPLSASLVGDGRSSFELEIPRLNGLLSLGRTQTITYVADDSNSRIIQRCTNEPSISQLLNGVAGGCQPYNGVVLTGYVNGVNQTVDLGLLGGVVSLLGGLGSTVGNILRYPSGEMPVNTSEITNTDTTRPIECEYRKAYDDSALLPQINDSAVFSYTCVIPLLPGSSGWSGYLTFNGGISLSITARMCRHRYPDEPGTDPNRRNVQRYQNVSQSLFNQNYTVVVNRTCESVDPAVMVQHQLCLPLGLLCART